jgi:hypothetical protein
MLACFKSAAVLLVLLACGGCRLFGMGDAQVSFFSEPPGARVIVDHQDTGFVTPCRLTLASRDDHKVDLELSGYSTARIDLDPNLDTDVIFWRDMALNLGQWYFPLWLNFQDTIHPFKLQANLHPGRVFVRLERAAAAQ